MQGALPNARVHDALPSEEKLSRPPQCDCDFPILLLDDNFTPTGQVLGRYFCDQIDYCVLYSTARPFPLACVDLTALLALELARRN